MQTIKAISNLKRLCTSKANGKLSRTGDTVENDGVFSVGGPRCRFTNSLLTPLPKIYWLFRFFMVLPYLTNNAEPLFFLDELILDDSVPLSTNAFQRLPEIFLQLLQLLQRSALTKCKHPVVSYLLTKHQVRS